MYNTQSLHQLDMNQTMNLLKTGELNFFNFYNSDIPIAQHCSVEYYLEHPKDIMDVEQLVNVGFTDIELYNPNDDDFDFESAHLPINAVTIVDTFSKHYHAYLLLADINVAKFGITNDPSFNYQTFITKIQIDIKKILVDYKYIDEDCELSIYLFNQEEQLLQAYWAKLMSIDPCIISGWNCLRKDQSLWLDDRIIEIGNSYENLPIYKFGHINKHKISPKQNEFKLTLATGHHIIGSENHKFPVYIKPEDSYKTLNSLIETKQDVSIDGISTLLENDNDVFVKLEKHKNVNSNLTYRDLILNNIDYLIDNFELLNIIFTDINIRNKVKPRLKNTVDPSYYQGTTFWKHKPSLWTYQSIKNDISKDDVINYIKNTDEIPFFLMHDDKTIIDISQTINDDILQLMGFIFTDGFWSVCDKCYSFYNSNIAIFNEHLNITNQFKHDDRNVFEPHQDCCYERISGLNVLGLLYPLIYNNNGKHLSKSILSQLSHSQFKAFFAGCIDGDGTIHSQALQLCNYEGTINNETMSELLLWNGIFSSIHGNTIYIPKTQYSHSFISTLPIKNDNCGLKLDDMEGHVVKNTPSKHIKKYEVEDYIIVKISEIINTGIQSELIDINTKDHLFISNGIETHNSDGFDYPYLYTRTHNLFGANRANVMMTRFGQVTRRGKFVSFPEYTILDLLHAYKPRDEGGLNLGKKQSQYTLDNIATVELGLKKIEYKSENVSLNELYENDPYWFLIYNIVDVALTYLLDKKLKHIDLYNGIRRIMKTGYAASIAGSSAIFDSLVYSKLIERGQYVRYGINTELRKNLDKNKLGGMPKLYDPKGKPCKIPKIQAREYSNILSKFPGAYVKEPNPVIINDGSLVIDLDAKALYPSMILQGNISFDSYIARILPVCTYKSLLLLEKHLGKGPVPQMLAQNIAKLCWGYGETVKAAKRETSIKMYNIIMYLFERVFASGLTFQQICNPVQFKDHVYLRHYVIPLLDALNLVHPDNKKYSQFAYDYIFMDRYDQNNVDLLEHKYPYIYMLYNPSDANARIIRYPLVEGIKEFQKYCLTLAGTLFSKHSEYMGLFSTFLTGMGNLRTQYKDARQTCERGTDAYNLNDNRQKSIKVVMNTTYGLYGLSTFRYSNHWLAQSITNNGMLTIKIAQQLGEDYLQYKYGNQQ